MSLCFRACCILSSVLLVRFNNDATIKIVFRTLSPASSDGVVELGGCCNKDIISNADCFRKSFIVTSGNYIFLGKNKTMSSSISALVCGIKHFTQR